MSAPNSRHPARGTMPYTPSSTPPPPSRIDTSATEPKSDYLRHALDMTRAKRTTLSRASTGIQPAKPETLNKVPSDPWLDNANDEHNITRSAPGRRPRRPSEGTIMPRMKTQRELQTEADRYKNTLFDLNMKLELLRKQNNDLKDRVEEYQKRIEEMEPLEDENHDLRDKNNQLMLKMQDMSDEISELHKQNVEILKIQEETVVNMEASNAGLQEAAEIIDRLEMEKAAFAHENAQLKEQTASLNSEPRYRSAIDRSAHDQYPARVYSIDESRPSTGHFDSDYYSQPSSPRGKVSKESLPPVIISERAKNFLSMKRESTQSFKDLKKRLSDASLKYKQRKEPMPQVPQIPEAYQQPSAAMVLNRTPKRNVQTSSLSPTLAVDPYASISSSNGPRTPTSQVDGLRGMFRDGLSLNTSSPHSRSSSIHTNSSHATRNLKTSRGSDGPFAPVRHSSRAAPTSQSAEQLTAGPEAEIHTTRGTATDTEAEWESMAPPSVVSEDLTTEIGVNNGQWWKSVGKWGSNGTRVPVSYPSSGTGSARPVPRDNRKSPYADGHFLFNPAEDEDQFIERTRSLGRGR